MVAAALAVTVGNAGAQSVGQLRGTWITTTGYSTGHVKDRLTTNTTYQRLSNAGINTVYIDAWRNGNTQFASPTLQAAIGRDRDPALAGRDLVAETTLQAHRQGMTNIAWFQYGFAAGFGNPSTANAFSVYARDRGWLLTDSAGAYTNASNSFAWMNPVVPEVRTFVKNIILETVRNYDLDGIQFDDRLAWPVQLGYDPATRAAYLAETGRQVPTNSSDSQFVAWRAQKVTEFAKEIFAAVKAERANAIVSVAPSTYPFSYTSYCVDWPSWTNTTVNVNGQNMPLFDEIIPQVYRSTASGFSSEWASEISSTNAARRGDLAAGISINNSSGAPYNWATVNLPQVQDVNNDPVAGHVWWYSAGVLDTNEANITSLYAGSFSSHHPDQTTDWRKASVDGVKLTSTTWQVTVPTGYVDTGNNLLGGTFVPIYRVGDTWTALPGVQMFSGETRVFTVPSSAVEVEVVVDRRQPTFVPVPRWLATGGGDWGTGSNWYTAAAPNSIGATAILGDSIAAASTINVDGTVRLGILQFDSLRNYTVSGLGAIQMQVLSGRSSIDVLRGSHEIAAELKLMSPVDISVGNGASLEISGSITSSEAPTVTKFGTGLLVVENPLHVGSLHVNGGRVELQGLVTSSLAVTEGATVDLDRSDLLLDYEGLSPLSALIAMWIDGRVVAEGSDAGLPTFLALAEAVDLGLDAFAGVAVDETTVVGKYTFVGDANLDGQVDALDYERIDLAIGNTGVFGTAQGDLNYDGNVDALDYEQVDLNIGNGVGSPLAAVLIPEPMVTGAIPLMLLAGRRHRR